MTRKKSNKNNDNLVNNNSNNNNNNNNDKTKQKVIPVEKTTVATDKNIKNNKNNNEINNKIEKKENEKPQISQRKISIADDKVEYKKTKKEIQFEKNLQEFYDKMKLKDLMLLRSPGQRAPLSSVIEDRRNKKVIFKLVFTSFLMFTVPIAAYFVVYLAGPRLYPNVEINYIQTIGGFVSLFFVLLIAFFYMIAAFLEHE